MTRPSVSRIVAALRKPAEHSGWVVAAATGEGLDPPEAWLSDMSAWVRANGRWVSGWAADVEGGVDSLEHFAFRPGLIDRWRIRRAFKAFGRTMSTRAAFKAMWSMFESSGAVSWPYEVDLEPQFRGLSS